MTKSTSDPPTTSFQPPRRIPPPHVRALLDVVQRYAEYYQVAPVRVQHWVSYMVLGGALARYAAEPNNPAFVLKGGVALELRLRRGARATKDFDATFRHGATTPLLDALDAAFAEPFAGFTLRRAGQPLFLTRLTRFQIKLEYRNRPWGTVTLEVSADASGGPPIDHVPAIDLRDFGLDGPHSLPCLALPTQIAQKLHAMTEPMPDGKRNERVRDLLDLWMLRDRVPPDSVLRVECEHVFAHRGTHPWPPQIVAHEHWLVPFSHLAADLSLAVTAEQAAGDVAAYVDEIVGAANQS